MLSKEFLIERGYCCGHGCLMCPYEPKHTKDNTVLAEDVCLYSGLPSPNSYRKKDKKIMKVGIVTGVFDLIHPGHFKLLQWCRERCEFLIVMLQKYTDERPNKRAPIQTWKERQLQLLGIRYVDEVIPYHTERDLSHLLSNHTPHIRFLGSDYQNTPHTGIELNQPVQYCDRFGDYSTTNLIQQIKES